MAFHSRHCQTNSATGSPTRTSAMSALRPAPRGSFRVGEKVPPGWHIVPRIRHHFSGGIVFLPESSSLIPERRHRTLPRVARVANTISRHADSCHGRCRLHRKPSRSIARRSRRTGADPGTARGNGGALATASCRAGLGRHPRSASGPRSSARLPARLSSRC